MRYSTIQLDSDGAVATVRLNRPERMNAVIEEMYEEILDALDGVERDPELRCVILTGSVLHRGGIAKQAFCAGADLKKHASGDRSQAERRAYIELAHRTTGRIHDFPKPILAAVNGPARGAGAEMALSCDLVFMATDATLAFPETSLGTFVGGGVTLLLPLLVGIARAKDLIYTGRVVDGREAVELGLAIRCFPIDRLLDEVREYARQLAAHAPISMALAKRHLHSSARLDLATALRVEAEAILDCMETEDWREGTRAAIERRPPRFEGR